LNNVHSAKRVPDESNKKYTLVLPFLGSYTAKVERKIKQSFKQHLPEVHINFVYRASARLRSMFAFKDKLPHYLQSSVVYKFKCGGCNSTYIGETVRHTKKRFYEHMMKSPLTEKRVSRVVPSAVNQHAAVCSSEVKYSDFEILCKDTVGGISRQIKETLFIHKDKPNLNDRKGSVPLVLF